MHTTRTLLPHSSLVLAACLALGACKAKDKEAAADTAAAPATATATPPAPAASPTESSAATANAPLSDANIVALLDEANSADSALAAAALPKATSADVKGFAKMMMGEHHALRIAGQQLAKKLNVTPELPANDPLPAAAKGETDALQGKTGADFDKTYISQEIGIHKAVIDLAGKAHDQTQNADLKALIEKAGPVLKKHLAEAERIAKKHGAPAA